MKIGMRKTVEVDAKTLKLHLKVSDRFSASIHDQDGTGIFEQKDGYVPDFMPGQHYGNYVILDIDIDSGQITNWAKPTVEQIQAFIGGGDEEDYWP